MGLPELVRLRDQLQKIRIQEGNRAPNNELHQQYAEELLAIEQKVTRNIEEEMQHHPAWPWLKDIRGVGATSAACVVGYIDISLSPTISALWRYAGFAVIDGARERRTKGEKLHYNARLKTMVWRLIDLQVRTRGPYRKIYDDAKHTYITTRGPNSAVDNPWTLGHCEAAARRKAAKLFLSHLWQVWREAEGLHVKEPFIAVAQLGHDIIDPWEFTRGVSLTQ